MQAARPLPSITSLSPLAKPALSKASTTRTSKSLRSEILSTLEKNYFLDSELIEKLDNLLKTHIESIVEGNPLNTIIKKFIEELKSSLQISKDLDPSTLIKELFQICINKGINFAADHSTLYNLCQNMITLKTISETFLAVSDQTIISRIFESQKILETDIYKISSKDILIDLKILSLKFVNNFFKLKTTLNQENIQYYLSFFSGIVSDFEKFYLFYKYFCLFLTQIYFHIKINEDVKNVQLKRQSDEARELIERQKKDQTLLSKADIESKINSLLLSIIANNDLYMQTQSISDKSKLKKKLKSNAAELWLLFTGTISTSTYLKENFSNIRELGSKTFNLIDLYSASGILKMSEIKQLIGDISNFQLKPTAAIRGGYKVNKNKKLRKYR